MASTVSSAVAPHRMFRPPLPPPPKPEASDFDRIGELGEGGFARVSKVRHRRTGDVFALKEAFYPSPDAKEEAEVLRRAAGSPSKYVVRCHAVFLGDGGEQASVLELMEAGSLYNVLCGYGGEPRFPEPVLAEVTRRCLMGLHELHSRGVAHLDVKPENFLANARGDIKINDFNTSRIIYGPDGKSLVVSTNMGTTPYFSPERFVRNARMEPRGAMAADVWGLGLTVLELFLGGLPIVPQADTPRTEDWKKAICDREPPSVPEDVEASADLRDFVAKCLHKDPARRARVSQLLNHPFVTRRDAAASSRELRDVILKSLKV